MTVSQHIYAAQIVGGTALKVKGGGVSLDSSRWPYVQGSIQIPMPSLATLAALDPRMSPAARIRLSVQATFPWGTQARTFDLTLRDRSIEHGSARVTLELASDEAILDEFTPLADDTGPLAYQASLRGLVGYVLGKVIPGAVLATGADVAVPALADSSNLIRNPRAGVNTGDWAASWTAGGLSIFRIASGGPAYAPTYVAYLSNSGVFTNNAEMYITEAAVSMTAGKQHVLSVSVSAGAGRQIILDAVCFDASGNIVGFIPPVPITGNNAWQRAATLPFGAYANTAKIRVRVRAAQLGGSEYVNVTGWRLCEATGDYAADCLYLDGDTADTAQYDYAWAQAAHASISTRKRLVNAATPDALTWKAGQSAMSFLSPLVQAAGLRLVCDENRVWTLRATGFKSDGVLSVRHAVNLVDGSEKISRRDEDWFDAAVARWRWTDRNGQSQERTDSYALAASYSRVRLFEFTTPYPGPGFAEYAVKRAQGRGREVTVTTVSDWTATAEQDVQIVLDGAATQTGQTISVAFNFDRDEMTINTRTIDTAPGAWILLPVGEKWTDSPAGASWTGEAA